MSEHTGPTTPTRPAGHLPELRWLIQDSLAESSWRSDAAAEGTRRWLAAATTDTLIASRLASGGVCAAAARRGGICCQYHAGMEAGFGRLRDLAAWETQP